MSSAGLPRELADGGSAERFIAFMVGRAMLEAGAADRARGAMERSGQPVDTVLSELGLMGEAGLAEAQAAFLDVPVTRREDYPEDPVLVEGLSPEFLQAAGLLPLGMDQDGLTLATARPLESDAIRSIAFFLDVPVRMRVALRSEIEAALRSLYGDSRSEGELDANSPADAAEDDVERLKDFAREAPIIRLVTRLVSEAAEGGASDIHLEPTASELRVRRRVDGALNTTEAIGRGLMAGVVTRIKILANLNIAERRLPQDGRMRIAVKGRDLDIRVSTTPTLNGESVVLRILDRASVPLSFSALGFSPVEETAIRDLIRNPNGIVLVTGPTGSGKTTTLYAALLELNREDTKIFTVEDPIEYQLPGISQMQVKSNVGLDFAACLRSILRQDPDIVMVGEIRDAETARIAIQAALTGHLVLSTLHTNSAAASITRLLDMGIDGYLVASTIRGIVAQRLVRRICSACGAPEALHPSVAAQLGQEADGAGPISAPRAVGCRACNFTGYSGRTTIAEILTIDPGLRALILERAPEERIEEQARAAGAASLGRSGLAKALRGETTIEEILRITRIER
ncbi:MAG: type II/IV secretion system protein [Rhizobiales bacterium]|nr:type II/IV secretion system protein [Hyphomicrobiales bacterium]